MNPFRTLCAALAIPLAVSAAEPRPWHIYLLFGQSNMAGGAATEAADRVVNPRVKVLNYTNCSGRSFNTWSNAVPSLHGCGDGLGPGDWFAKTMADSFPLDTIGLLPAAIPGVDIAFFMKGVVSSRRSEFSIPPDNKTYNSVYPLMVEKIKIAQKKGVLKGILFHQGESDWRDSARKTWVGKVKGIVDDLKADAGIGDVPFLAGELRHDGCCGAHNTYVAELAKALPKGYVVSSKDLEKANDDYHFTSRGYREFGKRYAAAMLKAMPPSTRTAFRGTGVVTWRFSRSGTTTILAFDAPQERIEVRNLSGRLIAKGSGTRLALPSDARSTLVFAAHDGTATTTGLTPPLR